MSYVIQASQEEQEERDEDNPIIIAEAKTPSTRWRSPTP